MILLLLRRLLPYVKKYLPLTTVLAVLCWLIASLRVPEPKSGFDINSFGKLPVLANGRLKPMDTVARASLLMIHGKGIVDNAQGKTLGPVEWLMEVLMRPATADQAKLFVITNPDVLGLFHWDQSRGKYYSFEELQPFLQEIDTQASAAEEKKKNHQSTDLFEREIVKLRERVMLYNRLKTSLHNDEGITFTDEIAGFEKLAERAKVAIGAKEGEANFSKEDMDAFGELVTQYNKLAEFVYLRPVPNVKYEDWQSVSASMLAAGRSGRIDPAVQFYAGMTQAYRANDAPAFNESTAKYQDFLAKNFPQFLKKPLYEFRFNQFEPFYKCILLYLFVFLLALFSWLFWPEALNKTAFWLLVLVLLVHTAALLSRMWLQGRPPVTNLYSSAIFIGWAACLLCVFLERIFRNGIGSFTAATMGFLTLIIAHHLSFDGDTLEMLQAVLDTNFWLATHVVAVTLGYAATFLAGFLAILYVVRGMFTSSLDKATAKSLSNMVYGILCFAMLFSFVGTVLGGLWADYSWGRFWGFDPKENGALLIVIWNAIILHARWGGFIRERGLMNMAMFGNIVTSFSWFGVNMLGAGLHSYGFMDHAYLWLLTFDFNQLLLICVGLLPLRYWASFNGGATKTEDATAAKEKAS